MKALRILALVAAALAVIAGVAIGAEGPSLLALAVLAASVVLALAEEVAARQEGHRWQLMRSRVFWGVLCITIVAVACAALPRFVIHGPVDAGSLATAVDGAADSGSGELASCRRAPANKEWHCHLLDRDGSSGYVVYRVRVRPHSSCWTATLEDNSENGMSRKLSGCVHLWQWSLLDGLV